MPRTTKLPPLTSPMATQSIYHSIVVDDSDNERPTKRIRIREPTPDPVPQFEDESDQTRSRARLEALPTELLWMILDASLEPSLIHVDRRLWYCLPSYQVYTKDLAFRALLPTHSSPNPRIRLSDPRIDPELAKLESAPHKVSVIQLREAVFSSSWFGERHFRHVHKRLFQYAVLRACMWHSATGPSRGQMRRIRAFAASIGENITAEQLSLRLRDEKDRPLNMLSSPLTLTLSAQHTTSVFTSVTMSIVEFGGVIPHDFLRQPITTRNIQHIQHICDTVTRGQSTASRIVCDYELLQKAFSASICNDDSLVFFTLFTLEALLDTTHGVVIDHRHLECAVRRGRTRFLIAIIKKLWSYPRRFRPSDADLIDLINRAKALNYIDWQKTTRILAMEVASMWKAAEVEDAGGQVNHVAHRWPPELKITMPDRRTCQSWFIPKDFRHETVSASFHVPCEAIMADFRQDWENCVMGPWRRLRDMKDLTPRFTSFFPSVWAC